MGRARHGANFQFHPALGRKPDYPAADRHRGLLLKARKIIMSGHRWSSPSRVDVSNQTLRIIAGNHLSQNLHHPLGHYRTRNPHSAEEKIRIVLERLRSEESKQKKL